MADNQAADVLPATEVSKGFQLAKSLRAWLEAILVVVSIVSAIATLVETITFMRHFHSLVGGSNYRPKPWFPWYRCKADKWHGPFINRRCVCEIEFDAESRANDREENLNILAWYQAKHSEN